MKTNKNKGMIKNLFFVGENITFSSICSQNVILSYFPGASLKVLVSGKLITKFILKRGSFEPV
jgi:hypothetical protein